MPPDHHPGSLLQSFKCALAGIICAVSSQRNMKIHLAAASLVAALAAVLQVSEVEWAILVLTVGSVIVTEAINTAIEAVVDLASPEFHELAKRAKDVAAGAVLIAAMASILVGVLIFAPRLSTLVTA